MGSKRCRAYGESKDNIRREFQKRAVEEVKLALCLLFN